MALRRFSPRRAAEIRSALQMAIGATAALYLATLLGLQYPFWSVISAIVVIQSSVSGAVLTVARDRAAGTVTGALIGAAAAFLRPAGFEGMAAAIGLTAAGLAFFGAGRPWLKIAPVTAAIVIAGGVGDEGPAALAIERVLEILVGTAVGVAAILALFPNHARQAFRLQCQDAARETAALLVLVLKGDPTKAAQVSRLHTGLKQRLDRLADAAKNVIDLGGPQREAADRAALVRAFWRVRSDIVILGRGFQVQGAAARLSPWAHDVQRAIAALEALSEGRAAEPMGPVEAALALSPTSVESDAARGAAAIGLDHLHRDLDDLSARFVDLRLV